MIEDNGVGISAENLEKLFKDYAKLDEHAEINQKGTGLGLSICKNLVEQMGGNVTVESKVGVGTKFNITLQQRCIDSNSVESVQNLQKNSFAPDFAEKFC